MCVCVCACVCVRVWESAFHTYLGHENVETIPKVVSLGLILSSFGVFCLLWCGQLMLTPL